MLPRGLRLGLGTKLWRSSAKATPAESVSMQDAIAMELLMFEHDPIGKMPYAWRLNAGPVGPDHALVTTDRGCQAERAIASCYLTTATLPDRGRLR